MPPKKDIVSKHGMVDYYKVMPKKFLLQSHNPNFKDHKLNLQFTFAYYWRERGR